MTNSLAKTAGTLLALAFACACPLCHAADFARLSPFTGVRWEGNKPSVKIDNQWYGLVSVDKVPAESIVSFSKRTFGSKWKKRFEEDIVELMSVMGHDTKQTVHVVAIPIGAAVEQTFERLPMTRENRGLIRDAAQERSQRAAATHPAVSIDDPDQMRESIEEFLVVAERKTGFSGVVAVSHQGKPVYEGAFGLSHLQSLEPNKGDSPFRIASLSKQFTAAAIFRLEAQGKIRVDAPVHQYLAEFAEPPHRNITIDQLLTHTSGLPRVPEREPGKQQWNKMSRNETPVGEYVRLAAQTPLKSEPGARYEYSNFGYRILSAVIARVSGRSYADFMEEELFQPLEMTHSGVARVGRPPSESVVAEGLSLKSVGPDGPVYVSGERGRNFGTGYGSGGIFCSARDLIKWDQVLHGDQFLSKPQKSRLFKPVLEDYACGWKVKRLPIDGRLYHSHSGSNQGFFSKMMRIPDERLVIVAVGNVDSTREIDEAIDQLFRLCCSLPYRCP